jgi:Iron-containing redox enzyme
MMRISVGDSPQKRLYIYNRTVPDTTAYADMLDIEREWAVCLATEHERRAPQFSSPEDLLTTLGELLDNEESSGPSEHEVFLAEEATLDQFRAVVAAFAVDGLVESQSHLGIIRRLPARARTAVMRVLIDEFGCGNDDQEHAQLYTKLVTELGMPTDLEYFVGLTQDECFAYVNLFHWFADRAPSPEYFLGAYSYFESSVLYAFRCYAQACDRLGIANGRYYTEHLYIDSFHSKQMRSSIRAFGRDRPMDLAKVWAGVTMTSEVVAKATEAAIGRARNMAAA